ncbi:MAG: UDP-N-acetylglucosamine 2-epimerase (hydrolyzing) [Leptolyngbya sp. SIOISBB]|nr:UDP-N-acetylglucosamine 2-epimerase (hydrolyzing) [Leptolyngbya sp. SIOISBB]
MRKVCVVITARTSYTKIKPILTALQQRPDVELQVVCAASAVLERYGKVEKIVEKDGFVINERIYMLLEAETLLTTAKSAGVGVGEFAGAFDRLKPDVVLVMADRYEVLSAAIAAAYQNIPLAHAQGGEVSGNIDEKVRHAITKLADLHFPATQRAADWIVRMGEATERVFCTGCPSTDLAEGVVRAPALDFDIYDKYGGVGAHPNLKRGYIIVMQHPVTTEFADAMKQVRETLHAVADWGRPVLWFWPNPDAGSDALSKGIRSFRENYNPPNIHFIKNMEPADFLRLLYASEGIVGNSSVAIRECSYLGVPAINIGNRQANRECGPNVRHVSYDRTEIKRAIVEHFVGRAERSTLYGSGNAGEQIAAVLATAPLTFSKSLHYPTVEA